MKRMIVSKAGFTLIELMVVVGIIGLLVAIALPNFSKFQRKARQSEAKVALGGVYTAEKSFYTEYNAYTGSLDAVGYQPEGIKRFYDVGFAAATVTTVTGYGGAGGNLSFPSLNGLPPLGCNAVLGMTGGLTAGTDAQTFTANANGNIGAAIAGPLNCDSWSMDELKALLNVNIGV